MSLDVLDHRMNLQGYDALDAFLEAAGIEHFSARELAHRRAPQPHLWGNIIPTLRYAEALRRLDEVDVIRVTSGYRDRDHNSAVGGASDSMHLYFNAMDIVPIYDGQPVPTEVVVELLSRIELADLLSVGAYRNFVHIDTRSIMFNRVPWRSE